MVSSYGCPMKMQNLWFDLMVVHVDGCLVDGCLLTPKNLEFLNSCWSDGAFGEEV